MEKVNLPTEKAFEPNEEAYQPPEETMTPRLVGQPTRKLIAFTDDTDTEKAPSRNNGYKDILSQPASSLPHRQKLLWLQKRRTAGLWAQCDDCSRWRFLPNVLDSYELPKKWYCRMNPDTANADCSIPEAPIRVRDEEDLIHSEYSAGSVVWARMTGFPWWPAMVDDCPDTEQFYWLDGFSDIPTHYNVVFFDSTEVTRAWIAPEYLKPYTAYKNSFKPFLKDKKHKTRLRAAINQADDATKLTLTDRLEKYSFVARYKGTVNTPRKVTQKELKKHQRFLKRRFDVEFDDSEDDSDAGPQKPPVKNMNVIVLGTPKKAGTRANRVSDITDAVTVTKKPEEIVEHETTDPDNTETKLADTERAIETSANDVLKGSNSLAVQVGSTTDSAVAEEPFDNDTSKTYVPVKESQESTQSTQLNTVTSEITAFQVTIASPRSDDFDF